MAFDDEDELDPEIPADEEMEDDDLDLGDDDEEEDDEDDLDPKKLDGLGFGIEDDEEVI